MKRMEVNQMPKGPRLIDQSCADCRRAQLTMQIAGEILCVMKIWPGGDGLRIIASNAPKGRDTAHRKRKMIDHITRK